MLLDPGLILHLDLVAHRFENLLKLGYLEQYLRGNDIAPQDLGHSRFDVYCLFLRFLARLVVYFLSPAANALRQLFPELLWMLDETQWFRAMLQESLAVMTLDTEASRDARALGLAGAPTAPTKTNLKAIHIVLDRLFIWFPVRCGMPIVRMVSQGVG